MSLNKLKNPVHKTLLKGT